MQPTSKIASFAGNTPNPPRPRFNSCRSEPRSNPWIPETSVPSDLCPSAFSSTPSLVTNSVVTTTSSSGSAAMSNGNAESSNDHRTNSVSPLRGNAPLENGGSAYVSSVPSTSSMNGSVSSAVYSTTSTSTTTVSAGGSLTEKPPIAPNEGRSSYRDQPASSASPPTRDKLRAEDKARRRMNQHGERAGTACPEKLGRYPRIHCRWLSCRELLRIRWPCVCFRFETDDLWI